MIQGRATSAAYRRVKRYESHERRRKPSLKRKPCIGKPTNVETHAQGTVSPDNSRVSLRVCAHSLQTLPRDSMIRRWASALTTCNTRRIAIFEDGSQIGERRGFHKLSTGSTIWCDAGEQNIHLLRQASGTLIGRAGQPYPQTQLSR